jgi:hypothetical protein
MTTFDSARDEPARMVVRNNEEGQYFSVPVFWAQEVAMDETEGTERDAAKGASDVTKWFRKMGMVKPR